MIEELKEAFKASTPGPWIAPVTNMFSDCTIEGRTAVRRNRVYVARVYGDGGTIVFAKASPEKRANAKFIALAHEAMPDLLEGLRLLNDFYDRAVEVGWHPDNSPMQGYRKLMERLK